MLYEQTVIETSLSRRDAIRLEKMKKHIGILTDEGSIDRGRTTAADPDSPGISEP